MRHKKITQFLQRLSQALLLPIAIIPIAGILLRLGEPDLLNIIESCKDESLKS